MRNVFVVGKIYSMLFPECIISILIIRVYLYGAIRSLFQCFQNCLVFSSNLFLSQHSASSFVIQWSDTKRAAVRMKRRKNAVAYFQVRLSTEESRRRISWKRHDPFNISAKTPATYDARESFDPCEKSWRKSAFDRQRIIPCNSRPTFTIPPLLIHGKEVSSSTNFSKAASFEIFIVRTYRILLSIKQVE